MFLLDYVGQLFWLGWFYATQFIDPVAFTLRFGLWKNLSGDAMVVRITGEVSRVLHCASEAISGTVNVTHCIDLLVSGRKVAFWNSLFCELIEIFLTVVMYALFLIVLSRGFVDLRKVLSGGVCRCNFESGSRNVVSWSKLRELELGVLVDA